MIADTADVLSSVIEAARLRLHIPGVAVGILHKGETYTEGFGVTNLENPVPVNVNTLFQIGSITKTFTGTAAMRLVEIGKLDLDMPVQHYLPDLRLSSDELTGRATLRHLFTHTAGWEGDYFDDYGPGDDAIALYTAHMAELPQLTPLGAIWSYNNAGFNLAGRVIEAVTDKTYEAAIKELVFDPLGMTSSFFFAADVMTHRFAVGHHKGEPFSVARPWPISRCSHPAGGISSTVTDLLRYARFHLGDGTTESGECLLKPETVKFMQSQLAPAGNWADFVGVTWMLRDVGGVRLLGHGGSTNGFNATFELSTEHDFALVVLTNADNGSLLYDEITEWALKHLLGIKKQKPSLLELSDHELGTYAGKYQATLWNVELKLQGHQLWLHMEYRGGFPTRDTPPPDEPPPAPMRLGFYDQDRALILDPPMEDSRAEFLRNPDGSIAWFRFSGRIHHPL